MVRRYITSYTHRRAFSQQRRPIADMTSGRSVCASTLQAQPIAIKAASRSTEFRTVLAMIASTSIDSYWEESVPPRSDACYTGSPEALPPSGH